MIFFCVDDTSVLWKKKKLPNIDFKLLGKKNR